MRFSRLTDRLAGLGSEKWAVHVAARGRAQRGEPVIMLSIGEPDLPPDVAVLDAAIGALRRGRSRYASGRGEAVVLDAIARRYTQLAGRQVTPAQCCFLPGTQTALFASMQALLDEGDEVVVGDPYYATSEGVVAAAGGRIRPVPTRPEDGFHLRADELERAITPRTRALLLNSPGNPTGAVLSRDEIAAIGEVCRRHDLAIVSDEVYAELTFGVPFASPLGIEALQDRAVVVSSISKSHALPGFRCGWAVGPADFAERLLAISEAMLFGSQPFLQDATAIALEVASGSAATMAASYQRRAHLAVERLSRSPVLATRMPEGGMFVMVDVRATGLSGEDFAWRLLERHAVAVMPGESFGAGGAGHLRLSLAIDDALLAEACDRIVACARNG
jgi:arginine:pyruvate transaminase